MSADASVCVWMSKQQLKLYTSIQGEGLPSPVCVVCFAFIIAVSVYQNSKTTGEI